MWVAGEGKKITKGRGRLRRGEEKKREEQEREDQCCGLEKWEDDVKWRWVKGEKVQGMRKKNNEV